MFGLCFDFDFGGARPLKCGGAKLAADISGIKFT